MHNTDYYSDQKAAPAFKRAFNHLDTNLRASRHNTSGMGATNITERCRHPHACCGSHQLATTCHSMTATMRLTSLACLMPT